MAENGPPGSLEMNRTWKPTSLVFRVQVNFAGSVRKILGRKVPEHMILSFLSLKMVFFCLMVTDELPRVESAKTWPNEQIQEEGL